ncbi:MCE family protein [Saccharopolyspora sp. HNM0983]|uniref:MCE family protein n=1 Tax=Saccharopolyspora montiporae TaxID=2781240 RepID=A0A929B912_9PSEU|nr:MCE family protein [Saccharopolyspora sp. HNM0983]
MKKIVIVACVLALVAAGGWYTVLRPGDTLSVTADFAFADGIFPGNRVSVLGVPVGNVESVVPRGSAVRVTMSLPADQRIPEGAHAYVVSPSIISDRYVELDPAYTGGPAMPDGARIPVERTHAPIKWDELSTSLDVVLSALGPDDDGRGGLGELVRTGAKLTGGEGERIRAAIRNVTQASEVAVNGSGDLRAVIDNVDQLLRLLVRHQDTIDELTDTTTRISQTFDAERDALGDTLTRMSSALTRVNDLVRTHGDRLTADVDQLAQVSGTIARHQHQLAETLDTLPLAMDNLGRTVTPDERMRLRLDVSTNLSQFDTTARLCEQLPLPLCDGAGLVNPIPFPPNVPDVVDQLAQNTPDDGGGG